LHARGLAAKVRLVSDEEPPNEQERDDEQELDEAQTRGEEQKRDDRTNAIRRRWMRVGVFLTFAAVCAYFVLPRVPRSQHVRIHLGVGSSRIVRVVARVSRDGKLDRETTLSYARGAPPTIEWEFELPNGEADVEVEVSSATGIETQQAHVDLETAEVTVEAAPAMQRLP
jgi:hypothetical protein